MRLNTVVIVHRGRMLGEALSAALSAYPGIRPLAVVTSAERARQIQDRVDAVALDAGIPGASKLATELRRRGIRVVFLGASPDEEEAAAVPADAAVADLAAALVPSAAMTPAASAAHRLTRREREILDLVARGLAAKQVASHLGISPKTVEQHKTRIFAKLGVRNQTAAVSILLGGHERPRPFALANGTPAA
ncbi:MAG: response regulator transcription factor [Actinomycetota bacterium]